MAKKGGAPTKSEIVATICKDSELSRKQVAAVFESLNGIIKKSLRGPGLFTLPGLVTPGQRTSNGVRNDSSKIQRLSNQPCSPR